MLFTLSANSRLNFILDMLIIIIINSLIIKKGRILGYTLACMVCAVWVNIIVLNSALF